MGLRLRKKKAAVEVIKELDAFPKIPDDVVEPTPVGGSVSIITFIIIIFLLYCEINYYLDSKFIFEYVIDTEYDAKLSINIDMTVAMPCHEIGADILDSTGQNIDNFGVLEEEDTWFELPPQQRKLFDNIKFTNSYLREEYHAISKFLWKNSHLIKYSDDDFYPPKTFDSLSKPYDACRLHGLLHLNKVAGNFHITAGKSLSLPRGHIHITAFTSERDYNFTHRINKFQFGKETPGILHPLEGDEKFTNKNTILYQYFIEVVPTSVHTFISQIDTYQYSVKENTREINHDQGSHGMPGIFFKYDFSALKINVKQERDNILTFLICLFATIKGIYIVAMVFDRILLYILDCFSKNSDSKRKLLEQF